MLRYPFGMYLKKKLKKKVSISWRILHLEPRKGSKKNLDLSLFLTDICLVLQTVTV